LKDIWSTCTLIRAVHAIASAIEAVVVQATRIPLLDGTNTTPAGYNLNVRATLSACPGVIVAMLVDLIDVGANKRYKAVQSFK